MRHQTTKPKLKELRDSGSIMLFRLGRKGEVSMRNAVKRQVVLVTGAALFAGALALGLLPAGPVAARGGQQWFSAWTVSHGMRLTTPSLAGGSMA